MPYRHTENVFGGSFSEDGQFLATYSTDKKLIIWEVSPVGPSKKSVVSGWVDDNLTAAQRKILSWETVNRLYDRVDPNMMSPRDEFETSAEYNNRRSALGDWTLALIQGEMEKHYGANDRDDQKVSVPLQSVVGYNADKQIYKVRFMETEAGVSIPIREARILKDKWKNASVLVTRRRVEPKRSSLYSDFSLTIPGVSGTFELVPVENPFNAGQSAPGRMGDPVSDEREPAVAQSSAPGEGIITHALLFATNVYDSFSELVNPVLDATTIGNELSENFGVETEVVVNPSLTQTVEKIREYASRKYSPNESLVIFFAGHGMYDEVFREGYIISSDSKANDISKTSYLSHSNLRTMVNNINCEHIFLVMDVCFGGTIDPYLAASSHRGAMEMYSDIPKEEFVERKMKYRTRLYLTSGGKEYVPDGRQGFHSPFARRFIEALRKYGGEDGILTTSEILQYVEKVDPQPRFGEFGDNEPGSDFILIAK
ncbi:MAG: caspase family protein [Bacteroidales bacterium]